MTSSTRCSREHAERCLKTLAAAYPDGALGTPQALAGMCARYAPELEPFHPAAVDRGCREAARKCIAFPTLARLLPFVEDAAAKVSDVIEARALPPPEGDLWDADYRQLGIGLQILRGKCLARAEGKDSARGLFAELVRERGGLAAAQHDLSGIYARDGDAGIVAVVDEAVAARKRVRADVARDVHAAAADMAMRMAAE